MITDLWVWGGTNEAHSVYIVIRYHTFKCDISLFLI